VMQIRDVMPDEVKALTKELRPELIHFSVKGVRSGKEAEKLLAWLTVNTCETGFCAMVRANERRFL